jgi:hypothetical protein
MKAFGYSIMKDGSEIIEYDMVSAYPRLLTNAAYGKGKNMKKVKKEETNGTPTEIEAPFEPSLKGSELKSLFRAYDASDAKVEKARGDLEKALDERSDIVEKIHDGAGKGPFSYKGKVLSPVCRTAKSTGQKRWFFKGPGTKDLIEV